MHCTTAASLEMSDEPKFIVLTLLILGTLQSYAQFSYSIKAGWSWPDIHNETLPGHNMILA